jgi:hypothetical protein
MKVAAAILALTGSAVAFAPSTSSSTKSFALRASASESMPGIVVPLGFFDPLGFADKADENTLKRYREAEVVHGRVAMLATAGFLVGEAAAGSTFLFDGSIKGPATSHLSQVPSPFWVALVFFISYAEFVRAQIGWVEPEAVPVDQPGLLRASYTPGDLGFDPLGLKPTDAFEFKLMQTKELQNGRLAMIAASGFMAQELVDKQGIVEHIRTSY